MFASPAKNSAQCTDVQSKLHSIWKQNYLMIDGFAKLESCNKFVLKSFCSQMLCKMLLLKCDNCCFAHFGHNSALQFSKAYSCSLLSCFHPTKHSLPPGHEESKKVPKLLQEQIAYCFAKVKCLAEISPRNPLPTTIAVKAVCQLYALSHSIRI